MINQALCELRGHSWVLEIVRHSKVNVDLIDEYMIRKAFFECNGCGAVKVEESRWTIFPAKKKD